MDYGEILKSLDFENITIEQIKGIDKKIKLLKKQSLIMTLYLTEKKLKEIFKKDNNYEIELRLSQDGEYKYLTSNVVNMKEENFNIKEEYAVNVEDVFFNLFGVDELNDCNKDNFSINMSQDDIAGQLMQFFLSKEEIVSFNKCRLEKKIDNSGLKTNKKMTVKV